MLDWAIVRCVTHVTVMCIKMEVYCETRWWRSVPSAILVLQRRVGNPGGSSNIGSYWLDSGFEQLTLCANMTGCSYSAENVYTCECFAQLHQFVQSISALRHLRYLHVNRSQSDVLMFSQLAPANIIRDSSPVSVLPRKKCRNALVWIRADLNTFNKRCF